MSRLVGLLAAVRLSAQRASEAAAPPPSRPNILFLFATVRGRTRFRAWGNAFTDLCDLFPTRSAWFHGDPARHRGGDLAARWWGEGDTVWRQSLFLPNRDLMRAVRDERYKLIVYPQVTSDSCSISPAIPTSCAISRPTPRPGRP